MDIKESQQTHKHFKNIEKVITHATFDETRFDMLFKTM
jgi:hypothetical protein